MRSYADQKDPKRSAVGFAVVVALHAVLIWGLINGLGHRMIDVIKGPLVTKIIPQVKPPEQKTPPPPPPITAPPPPPYIPPPLVTVDTPSSANAITVQNTTPPPVVQAFKPAPAPVVQDEDVTVASFGGKTPEYPEDLQEDGTEGTASIQCTFNVDGTASDCRIAKVSGDAEFGRVALQFVENTRFSPATRGGKAISETVVVPFKFQLKD